MVTTFNKASYQGRPDEAAAASHKNTVAHVN